jgi:hypothetical protein
MNSNIHHIGAERMKSKMKLRVFENRDGRPTRALMPSTVRMYPTHIGKNAQWDRTPSVPQLTHQKMATRTTPNHPYPGKRAMTFFI